MQRVGEKNTNEVWKVKIALPSFPTTVLESRPAAKICDKSCGNSISFSAFFNVYCRQPPTLSEVFGFLKVEKMEVWDIGRWSGGCIVVPIWYSNFNPFLLSFSTPCCIVLRTLLLQIPFFSQNWTHFNVFETKKSLILNETF